MAQAHASSRSPRRYRTHAAALCALLLAACGGGGGGGGGAGTAAPEPPGFVASSVEEAIERGVNRGLDGIWVYVEGSDGASELVAAGIQDRASAEPAQPDALFKIASISKLFIACSAVKLSESGVLRLEDRLSTWLPELSGRIDNADEISVRNLLQHRSGVPDFDSQPGFSWRQPHSVIEALLALVLDRPADFSPDARYEYSNTNYLLLGMILDRSLGYSHRDFVRNTILSPLGMFDTYSLLQEAELARLAHGYWDNVDRTGQDYVAPGGSMVSTASDTGRFLRALATGELLDAEERRVYLSLFDGFTHSGWLPGYQSIARYHPDIRAVVVQFVNTTGGNSETVSQEVYDSILDYLRSRP